MTTGLRGGPLGRIRVVLVGGIGPAPFAAMMLADLGADVVYLVRPSDSHRHRYMARNQRWLELDLQAKEGTSTALAILDRADILIEGFRPGVMERLGLGPDLVMARNQSLIYGRITGWGQRGPLSQSAGHDVNYAALTGALHSVGTVDEPVIPLNLVADFAGGSLHLCMGVLAALHHARETGQGQVVDCAMVDGAASLMHLFYELKANGQWRPRGLNLLDGGAPFYNVYRCADGRWISVGAIEPQFYALLCEKLELPPPERERQNDQAQWPSRKQRIGDLVLRKTRAEWCEILEGTDVCFAPVLDMDEAPHHPHNVARSTFVSVGGVMLPAPAPRFSATPLTTPFSRPDQSVSAKSVLDDWATGIP